MPISSALGSSALLPAGLGFRNAIINGDFRINQRGFTSTTTFLAYGHDRWRLSTLGDGTSTYTTQTFTLGNAIAGYEPTNYAQLVSAGQTTTASGTNLQQPIENVRTFAGQTVIISFWAKTTSGTPKVAIELVQNFGTTGSPSSSVNTYCGQVTLSTSWTRYSVTVVVPSISGKTLGTDVNSSSLNLLLWSSAGSDYNARTGSLGIQSTTVQYWGVQVEQNYQPTPFEQRPIGTELALCQRYFFKFISAGISYLSFQYAGTQYRLTLPHPVQMRVAPHTVSSSTWQGGTTPTLGVPSVLATNWSATGGWFYINESTSIEVSAEL